MDYVQQYDMGFSLHYFFRYLIVQLDEHATGCTATHGWGNLRGYFWAFQSHHHLYPLVI